MLNPQLLVIAAFSFSFCERYGAAVSVVKVSMLVEITAAKRSKPLHVCEAKVPSR
jgi:hypothetical protein